MRGGGVGFLCLREGDVLGGGVYGGRGVKGGGRGEGGKGS